MKRPSWGGSGTGRQIGRVRAAACLLVALVAAFALNSCATPVNARQTAQVYYDLGNAYSKLGEQDKATAAYLNALKLDSSLRQASYNLARAYIEAGNYEKAFSLLDGLLSKDPENVIVLDTLGYAYFRKGDKEKALSYYEQVLQLSPTDENALFNSATIYADMGQNQKAIDTFSHLYKISNDSSILLILGKLELAAGRAGQGIHYLEAYRQAKPDDLEGLTILAGAYRKEQLYDKALNAYDAVLKIKPDNADVLFAKAEILLTAIQDGANGMKALTAAVAAGYSDRKALDALVSNPELVDKSAVEELLRTKKLIEQKSATSASSSRS